MTDPVQLGHGFIRIEFGTALRDFGLSKNMFGSALDVDQVNLDQLGFERV